MLGSYFTRVISTNGLCRRVLILSTGIYLTVASILILLLIFHENIGISKFQILFSAVLTNLLLAITTVLLALYWYSTKRLHGRDVSIFIFTVWLVFRIGLVVALFPDFNSTDPVKFDDRGDGSIFGMWPGLLICIALCGGLALIVLLRFRMLRSELKALAIAACMCPLLTLIWITMEMGFTFIAIDYMVTAYLLGWILSSVRFFAPTQSVGSGTKSALSMLG